MSIVSSEAIFLQCGPARCAVAPEAGGAIAGFSWDRGGECLDWLGPASARALARCEPGAMACLPLVPLAAGIPDGRFVFCGREVHDPRLEARQGHAAQLPWQVERRGEESVTLACLHEPDAWPWRYRAQQTVRLDLDGLHVTFEIENLSEALMPAGLGFRLVLPGGCRPAVAFAETGCAAEFARAAMPDAVSQRESEFGGWLGRAVIRWPDRAAELVLEAEQPLLSFLALSLGPGAEWLSLTPASHCADAINRARQGAADTGIRVLAPGARRSAAIRLRPEAARR